MWPAELADRGFAVLPSVLGPAEVERLLEALHQPGPARSRAGIRHALALGPVANLARDERLLEIARMVLGPAAFPFHATLFDKSGAANWLVAWHQDTALPLRQRRETPGWGPWSVKDGVTYAHAPAEALAQVLALRVHLDDSGAHNGPLRVLAGTYKSGVLGDGAIHRLAGEIPVAECLAARGGVLAMRPLLVHASSKSLSALPRRVLHIEYAATPTVGDGLELAFC